MSHHPRNAGSDYRSSARPASSTSGARECPVLFSPGLGVRQVRQARLPGDHGSCVMRASISAGVLATGPSSGQSPGWWVGSEMPAAYSSSLKALDQRVLQRLPPGGQDMASGYLRSNIGLEVAYALRTPNFGMPDVPAQGFDHHVQHALPFSGAPILFLQPTSPCSRNNSISNPSSNFHRLNCVPSICPLTSRSTKHLSSRFREWAV